MRYDKIHSKLGRLEEKLREAQEESNRLKAENTTVKQALNSTLHEVRRFSTALSDDAEQLSKLTAEISPQAKILSDTMLFTSGMISSRLAFTDIELNPLAVRMQTRVRSGFYRKFEKAKHVLAGQASRKKVQVAFNGNSYVEILALPAFELVPFVILDNAIKYSPERQKVDVLFDEKSNAVKVIVKSIGPMVEKDELTCIFERGTRGKHTKNWPGSGEGLGLYLAKDLCARHEIGIFAQSDSNPRFNLGGIPYSDFSIHMEFAPR